MIVICRDCGRKTSVDLQFIEGLSTRTGISKEEKGYFLPLKHSIKVPVAKLEWIEI